MSRIPGVWERFGIKFGFTEVCAKPCVIEGGCTEGSNTPVVGGGGQREARPRGTSACGRVPCRNITLRQGHPMPLAHLVHIRSMVNQDTTLI